MNDPVKLQQEQQRELVEYYKPCVGPPKQNPPCRSSNPKWAGKACTNPECIICPGEGWEHGQCKHGRIFISRQFKEEL